MKCHYCDNTATKMVVWLKNKKGEAARIPLPWCGCDLMTALKKFWPSPYQVVEGRDYAIEPLVKTEPIKLDQFGMAVWKHKTNKNLFVERSYEWCDRVVVLDETDGSRRIVDDAKFTTFDFTDWIPVTESEFKKVKGFFKEIYDGILPD